METHEREMRRRGIFFLKVLSPVLHSRGLPVVALDRHVRFRPPGPLLGPNYFARLKARCTAISHEFRELPLKRQRTDCGAHVRDRVGSAYFNGETHRNVSPCADRMDPDTRSCRTNTSHLGAQNIKQPRPPTTREYPRRIKVSARGARSRASEKRSDSVPRKAE